MVPPEAAAFLGAVFVFLLVLVVLFLYLNKLLCFSKCGGFPCLERNTKKPLNQTLGTAYQLDEDTSSDSDDEILKHYQGLVKSASIRSARSSISKKSVQGSKTRADGDSVVTKQPSSESVVKTEDPATVLIEHGLVTSNLSSELEQKEQNTNLKTPSSPASTNTVFTAHSQEARTESSMPGAGCGHPDQLTFENRAFSTEDTFHQSLSGSEQGLSTHRLLSDEHLFDVSDLQHEPQLISKCGSVEVTFAYDATKKKLAITIHRAREIPAKDRGGASSTQVRVLLLPTKKQRFKTKVKQGEEPVYEETFTFSKIIPEEIPGMGLRFRLYGIERMRRERMVGESVIGFASLNLEEKSTHWVILEPRSNLSHGDSGFDVSSLSRSDSASSTQSLQHGGMPELLLGLAYNGTTGRLAVQVIKGSNFRNMAMNRAPDTYVKLTLMSPTGQELQRCKTSVRRGQPNPLFKETFMLQVAQFQLPDVTLMISVYNKKSMKKKEMIGWFSLGHNSSGEEESSHWTDMRESKGDEVCRWHVLLES